MKNLHRPIYHHLLYTMLILAAISLLYVATQRHIDVNFQNESLYSLNDNWIYHADNGNLYSITLPTTLDAGTDNSITISNQIPDDYRRITSIGILTSHQSIVAYLDNHLIYSRIADTDSEHFFNVPPGSIWDIIPLMPHSENKTLTLVISSEYKDCVGKINEIHAGTRASILLHTINTFGSGFLFSVVNLFIGAFLIYMYVFIKRLLREDKSTYYLGWFSILSSLWLLMESNLTQLFLSNAYIIATLSYLSFMIFPIPILLHVNLMSNYHFKRLNTWLINILLFNNIVLLILQFFNISDFKDTLPIVRSILYIILSISLITLWIELIRYKNMEVKIFTIASSILFIFSVIELFQYQLQSELHTGNYFRIGFYIFIFILTWDGIKKVVSFVKLSERAAHYRLLAYRDPLSNCRNRAAYEMDIKQVDTSRIITIFMADMNNMKEINDTFGHHTGDEVIILCSQCLIKVFGRSVYRIGGDEYLSIQYNLTQKDIELLLQAFQEECDKTNEDIPYKLSLSVGYATYDPSTDYSIHDTVKRADLMMYEVKEQLREQNKD